MKNQNAANGMKEYTSTLARRYRFEGSGIPRGLECRQEGGKRAYSAKREVCPERHLSAGTRLKVKKSVRQLDSQACLTEGLGISPENRRIFKVLQKASFTRYRRCNKPSYIFRHLGWELNSANWRLIRR